MGIMSIQEECILDFYPRFGFRRAAEYQYVKKWKGDNLPGARAVPMKNKEDFQKLENAIAASTWNAGLGMEANIPLIMFYVTKFMQNNVYFVEKENAYVIAESDSGRLYLQEVIADHQVELDRIIAAFGAGTEEVVLGFTPLKKEGYEIRMVEEEDTTLFVDEGFEDWEQKKQMFPVLSHA